MNVQIALAVIRPFYPALLAEFGKPGTAARVQDGQIEAQSFVGKVTQGPQLRVRYSFLSPSIGSPSVAALL